MIDIWVKLVANQFEVALNTTVAVLGLGGREAPVSVPVDPVAATIPDQAESQTGSAQAEAAIIPGIISFLDSANRGATVREIAEHLEMDKRSILPLLKTLVKERRIDELLGRYCVLKS